MSIEHDLKQRIVGAAVITALAAIFVPMLFDDPLDESGKVVSELTIPEPPQVQAPEQVPASDENPDIAPDKSAQGASNLEALANSANSTEAGTLEEDFPDHEGMTEDEIAAEVEADKKAAARLAQELDAGQPVKRPLELAQKEKTVTKKPPVKLLTDAPIEDDLVVDSNVAEKKTTEKLQKEAALLGKSFAEKKAKEALAEKKLAERIAKEADISERKLLERELAEKRVAEKMAQEELLVEKKAKEKAIAEKIAAEKLALQQAEEYKKLAEKKAKEKELAEKKAAENAVAEEKLAAKQQALNDKDAAVKIAADKKATEQAIAEKKSDDAAPVVARWYIRMASFSKEANAMALRDKLRKQGYPAVLDVVTTTDKGKLYRLRVGPEVNKERAEKNRQKLDAENSSTSILELE